MIFEKMDLLGLKKVSVGLPNVKRYRSFNGAGHTVQQLLRMNRVQRMSDIDKRKIFRLLGDHI